MRGIFYELMVEANIGKVQIDDDDIEIAFHTIVNNSDNKRQEYNDNYITLMINNQKEFFDLLEKYINLELKKERKTREFYREKNKNTIKWIMAYLFVNATTEEFLKPEDLLRRKMDFLNDKTFDSLNEGIEIPLGAVFKNSNICIKKEVCPVSMETPYRLDFSLTRGKVRYPLPSIYYGISESVCYLYGIQQPKKKLSRGIQEAKYQKEMNRLLYKINEGVPSKDSKFYQNDENYMDVTHSFVLVLDIFTKLLKSRGIDIVKGVTYLPIRYQAMEIWGDTLPIDKKEEVLQENERIQSNLTDKFVRTIRRLEFQDSSLEITSYPYDVDEYITFKLKKSGIANNDLLKDIDDSIKIRR